ncbi:MAG TPA: hypothetical protein VH054_06980 [Polyangiaceae bacterium]|jgi:hypothetical protein|nr:hypothetical protein [Polyangiaceae bacterium]
MSSTTVARALAAVLLFSAGSAPRNAIAQTNASDAAIAQSLFDEGRKLMNEKKFPEACPRLERSYKLDAAPGTLLNLAVCHEAIGKTATAWNEFRDTVMIAKRENRNDRLTFAQKHLKVLEGQIPTLTVNDQTRESGLEWRLDGVKVGVESFGIALPIDPGAHTIDATAPGHATWKTSIDVEKGDKKTLEIPALVVAILPKEQPHPPEPPPVVIEKSRGPSPWIWVTIGVGVAGWGAFALGGIEAMDNWNTRKNSCGIGGDPNACNQSGVDADKNARTWALVADIGLGVGAAATVATIIIAAVGRPKAKDTHVSVSPFGVSFATTF